MDRRLLTLTMMLALAGAGFAGYVTLYEPLTKQTQAANIRVSAEKSLMFGYPVDLNANGADQSTITVFARSDEEKPAGEKTVVFETSAGTVNPPQVTTDETGKATATITSTTPGVATVTVRVDNVELSKKLTVQFR